MLGQEDEIQWLSFEQLEDSLSIKPKKVFIEFYADWCAYCKKMNKAAFKDKGIISLLNSEYYAVKMDAESTDTIVFGGDSYRNKEVGQKRNPTHEIPLLLASRENYPFSLPAMVILNEKFEVTSRYFEYLSPKKLNRILDNP
ncbi:MAG: thioredoxin fold domain-containing protein [Bacteroidota bacterium]